MPLAESGIEIEATLTIVDNDFVLSGDVSPIPTLSEFHEIRLQTTTLICSFDCTKAGYVRKEYTYNSKKLPAMVSCAGQWAEDYIWYFDFNESIYDQVKALLDEKSINYELPNAVGMYLVKMV